MYLCVSKVIIMRITHISVECYPIAKVGGLADVVGALPKHQNTAKTVSQVIMPFYDNEFTQKHQFKVLFKEKLSLGSESFAYEILSLRENELGFEVFFVKIPDLLYQEYVYSHDDINRFLAFQIAVLDYILTREEKPTIIHCHDHHTALIPFMLQESYKYRSLNRIPSILTIHNATYQGWFSYDKVDLLPKFNFNNVGLLDWNHSINSLAAGIKCAWRVTTVSPSYMEELQLNANGLENLLHDESEKCVGIINGIDTDVWNTKTDPFLVKNYVQRTVVSGKKANKRWLCEAFNLPVDKALFVFIGRLVNEKGVDLFPELIPKALRKNDISILILGSGKEKMQNELETLKKNNEAKYNAYMGYDEKLAHIMYAGADFLLMPSRIEPCGLNQMYAMRYGTLPIVNNVGGLKDTVIDLEEEDGYGIVLNKLSVPEMLKAVDRAVKLRQNQKEFKKIRKTLMLIDFSWDASANQYLELYQTLIN